MISPLFVKVGGNIVQYLGFIVTYFQNSLPVSDTSCIGIDEHFVIIHVLFDFYLNIQEPVETG